MEVVAGAITAAPQGLLLQSSERSLNVNDPCAGIRKKHHSLTQNGKTSHPSAGVRCMHVRARECVFTPGVAGMICTAGDTKNSQNAREEGKGGYFVATPPDGRSRFSDWLVSGG